MCVSEILKSIEFLCINLFCISQMRISWCVCLCVIKVNYFCVITYSILVNENIFENILIYFQCMCVC